MQMLEDIKVLDFTTNVAGPSAAAIFTDYGATVYHVESPEGDAVRSLFPRVDGHSLAHGWMNRGKKSLVLNLKDPRAVEVVKKLAAECDVFLEGYRPGVMARLGLGYDVIKEINPKIIYCHLSAFGQTGPYAKKAGYDLIGQAVSGMVSTTGEKGGRPLKHGVTIADLYAGTNTFAAIMTALHHQRRTGEGQEIDSSLLQGMVYLNQAIDKLNEGIVVEPNGSHHTSMCPFGTFYNDKNEGVVICAQAGAGWNNLVKAMNRPDFFENPKYETVLSRAQNQEELIAEIEKWLCTFPGIAAAIECLEKFDVPCCRVNTTLDVVNDPQVQHMGLIVQAPVPDGITSRETFLTRGPFAKFSKRPGEIRKAPALGEHTKDTLEQLGYSEAEISEMLDAWKPKA